VREFAAKLLSSDGPAVPDTNGSSQRGDNVVDAVAPLEHGLGARGHRQCLVPLSDKDKGKIHALLRSEVVQVTDFFK
jgi:hypothetical protein